MSWSTDRTTIVSGLPSGYTLIPENKEPEDAEFANKSYSLKLSGVTDLDYHSSNVMLYSHVVKMRVLYKDVDGTQRITNEGLAMTLMQTISSLSGFHLYSENPMIEEIDNKKFVFTLVFHFGLDDNE